MAHRQKVTLYEADGWGECWLRMWRLFHHGGGGPAVLTAAPRCSIGVRGRWSRRYVSHDWLQRRCLPATDADLAKVLMAGGIAM
jgi:hypothetical protein